MKYMIWNIKVGKLPMNISVHQSTNNGAHVECFWWITWKYIYTRNIHQIFITTPSMFKNYIKHVYKPMNGQVIASPFWFASVGNGS